MMIDHWNSHETAAMGAAFDMVLKAIDGLGQNVAVRNGIASAILWAARNGETDPNRLAETGLSAIPGLVKQDRTVVLISRSPLTSGGGRASRPVTAPRRRAVGMVAAE